MMNFGGLGLTLPIGVSTAAVPQAKVSLSRPAGGILAPFAENVRLLANRDAFALRHGDDRGARDAGQDRAADRWRLHRAVVEHEEDVHAAELLDPAPLDGVDKHHLLAAVLGGLQLRQQAGRVVPPHFTAPVPPGAARVRSCDTHTDTALSFDLKYEPTGEAITRKRYSDDDLTPRKTSLANMKGRR